MGHVNNPKEAPAAGRAPENCWGIVDVKAVNRIPVFLGAAWARMYVLHMNEPPECEGDVWKSGIANRSISFFAKKSRLIIILGKSFFIVPKNSFYSL